MSHDLNQDGIDDLVVLADTLAGDTSFPNLVVTYGSSSRVQLPTVFGTFENVSIPGSGSFVVDRGTGRPDVSRTATRRSRCHWVRPNVGSDFPIGRWKPGDTIRLIQSEDSQWMWTST